MITVGIPTRNEEKTIAKCINVLLKQISKKDEVIVVSDGSTDRTVEEVKRIMKKDKRVRLIIVPERKGKANGLNLIIKNAKNDIIVQTDGDVIPEENSVKYLLKYFKNAKIGGVSGHPMPVIPKGNLFYEWAIMSYRKAHELREKQSKQGNLWHISGYLLAFRKKALPEVPDARGAVDAWMGKIIQQNGYKMVYEPRANVFVGCPTTVKDFINQKTRVRAGYYFLSQQTGKAPRRVEREIFWLPKELMKIPIKRWPAFLTSAFIYTYTWLRGWFFFKKNKSLVEIWKPIGSTK